MIPSSWTEWAENILSKMTIIERDQYIHVVEVLRHIAAVNTTPRHEFLADVATMLASRQVGTSRKASIQPELASREHRRKEAARCELATRSVFLRWKEYIETEFSKICMHAHWVMDVGTLTIDKGDLLLDEVPLPPHRFDNLSLTMRAQILDSLPYLVDRLDDHIAEFLTENDPESWPLP